ncbi:MAG TPA: DnaJ domain-containing protein [Xanthobacteraceae bacterium]
MKTLYDLLGALPDDDAESLRAAFRKAANANHPDKNHGDPDAPQKFRRILRANSILRDERQRAHYDRLLEIALQQRGLGAKRGIFLLVVLFGGYLLLGNVSKIPLAPAHVVEVFEREAKQTGLVISSELSDRIGRGGPREKLDDIATPKKPENQKTPKEATTPSATVPPESADSAALSAKPPPARDLETKDAKYYRDRGISAYRNGDLNLALVDFDLAISLDPSASGAYIDRSIVYHRMGDLKRAFADVSQAKRIDDSNRSKASPTAVSTR